MSRENHIPVIDAFTSALNAAMKEKHAANAHKRPLSEELDGALIRGMEDEFGEIKTEAYGAIRFQFDAYAVVLEFADFCNYGAEYLRRIGALRVEDSGQIRESDDVLPRKQWLDLRRRLRCLGASVVYERPLFNSRSVVQAVKSRLRKGRQRRAGG